MRYNIEGLDQNSLVECGLNLVDAMILRYILDLEKSSKILRETFNGKEYFWLRYSAVIENLPILNIKNRTVLSRRIDKMINAGFLEKHVLKQGGTFTFFRITDKLKSIDVFTKESIGGTPKSKDGIDSKVDTKDSSINNSSINNSKDSGEKEPPLFKPKPKKEPPDPRVKELHDFYLEKQKPHGEYAPKYAIERKKIKESIRLADLIDKEKAVEIVRGKLIVFFQQDGFYAKRRWNLNDFVQNFNVWGVEIKPNEKKLTDGEKRVLDYWKRQGIEI
jgi:hypothetical protein